MTILPSSYDSIGITRRPVRGFRFPLTEHLAAPNRFQFFFIFI
ncbi:MAG: hypothetical protein JWP38_701 [Herbaspirillum sp.]|nr:hypothetical protein [Herbaspirillum sp.]